MRFDSIIDSIGATPLVRLHGPTFADVEVYAKLELQNPFAMKDRVARHVITEARRSGELCAGAPIVESSSGTMALGLALVGTYLGHPVHIVTDPRIDRITRTKLEALGCVVHVVETMTGQGWQGARLERLALLMAELDGAFWPRQYVNPENPAAYRGLAAELHDDLGGLDVLVGAVGSGGSLCGTARVLRTLCPDLTVVAVDCVGSVLFAQPDWPQRRQSGLGNSLHPENLDHTLIDEVHWLNDVEAFDAAQRLAREQKIFGGNTAGSVYRVLRHLAERAAPGTRLVGILPDRGDRYVDTVYVPAAGPVAPAPRRVRYGTPVAEWSFADLGRCTRRRLVFVEANTTGSGMLALRTAVRLGFEPILVASRPQRYVGLSDTACRVIECDTNDPVALREVLATEIGHDRLAGVLTTSEFYLVPVAELAAELGIPGNPPTALAACRHKSLTRATLAAAGVAQPTFATVCRVADAGDAVTGIGLPCVVKPDDDSGSNEVVLCRSAAEAAETVERILAVKTNVRQQPSTGVALVERYLDGPEFSVEAFATDGGIVCIGATEKTVVASPHFVESQHVFPAETSDEVAAALLGTATSALRAVGFARGASHVELKLLDTGPAIVEINGRLAGGMIPELIRLATGIDLLEQQVREFAGLPVRLDATHFGCAGIRFLLADQPGRLCRISGVPAARRIAGVERVTITARPGVRVRVPRNAYDRLGHVIALGRSQAEVRERLQVATDRIRIDVEEDQSS